MMTWNDLKILIKLHIMYALEFAFVENLKYQHN